MNNALASLRDRWIERKRLHLLNTARYFSVMVMIFAAVAMSFDWSTTHAEENAASFNLLLASRTLGFAIGAFIFIATFRLRGKLSHGVLRVLISALLCPMALTIWIATMRYSVSAGHLNPPPGFKLALVVLPCLEMGGFGMNIGWMLAFFAESLLCWHLYVVPADGARATVELQALGFFALAGVFILFFRRSRQDSVYQLFSAMERASTAEYLTKVFLNIRDRANTPLQSLEIGLSLIQNDSSDPAVKRNLNHAFAKLKDLFRELLKAETLLENEKPE